MSYAKIHSKAQALSASAPTADREQDSQEHRRGSFAGAAAVPSSGTISHESQEGGASGESHGGTVSRVVDSVKRATLGAQATVLETTEELVRTRERLADLQSQLIAQQKHNSEAQAAVTALDARNSGM